MDGIRTSAGEEFRGMHLGSLPCAATIINLDVIIMMQFSQVRLAYSYSHDAIT